MTLINKFTMTNATEIFYKNIKIIIVFNFVSFYNEI